MYNTPKKIEYEIEDISKDRERPAKSNQLPNIGISMIIEPILIKAAKPTLVDPITCNFAENIEANSVHGSDAPETAAQEIAYWFADTEIVG